MSHVANRISPTNLNNIRGTSIPLRKPPLNRTSSSPEPQSKIPTSKNNLSMDSHKWKQKYEETEKNRKSIFAENVKISRTLADVRKKLDDLHVKHEHLETELFEKNEEYTKLSTASKSLFMEYEKLKNQYETESYAMNSALKDASQWYKENKELKRRTMLLLETDSVDADEGVDACETSSDSDIENHNRIIKQLSAEVAELQTELDAVKQQEFQTCEHNIKLQEELESEKQKSENFEKELIALKKDHEQLLRVSEMLKKQLQDLKESEENIKKDVVTLKKESDGYKKERNVLAHRSTILLQDFSSDNGMLLLEEMEDLKRTLEDERNKHNEEINALQEKLEDQETNAEVELLEEKLKLAESELLAALERAEKAEEKLKAPPAPPLPPPPPPAPLIMPNQPPVVPLRIKRRSRPNIQELAETIGVESDIDNSGKKILNGTTGVNVDIINAIKQGNFTLKKAKSDSKKERETPKAVSELLNILGSLRRAPKKRQSQYIGDVQL